MSYFEQFRQMLDSLDDGEAKEGLIEGFEKIEGLHKDAIKTRDTAKVNNRDLKSFKDGIKNLLDIDAEDFSIEDIEKLIEDAGEKDTSDEVQKLTEKHQSELDQLRTALTDRETALDELQSQNNDLLFKSTIEDARLLSGFKDNPMMRKTVVDHLKSKLIYKDGKVYVKDENGEDIAKDIKTGDPLSPSSVIDGMKQDSVWADYISPQQGHGGGKTPFNSGNSNGASDKDAEKAKKTGDLSGFFAAKMNS